MSDKTTRLNLPRILPAQAQKHVTLTCPSSGCLSPLKLCHYLFSSGVDEDGTEETFRRRYIEVVARD